MVFPTLVPAVVWAASGAALFPGLGCVLCGQVWDVQVHLAARWWVTCVSFQTIVATCSHGGVDWRGAEALARAVQPYSGRASFQTLLCAVVWGPILVRRF